jgi:hypothetical protein
MADMRQAGSHLPIVGPMWTMCWKRLWKAKPSTDLGFNRRNPSRKFSTSLSRAPRSTSPKQNGRALAPSAGRACSSPISQSGFCRALLWQCGTRLGFHQRDIRAVQRIVHGDIAAEVTAGNSLAGAGFCLANVSRVNRFVVRGIAEQHRHGHRYITRAIGVGHALERYNNSLRVSYTGEIDCHFRCRTSLGPAGCP